jgi:hypothetical protein
MSPSSTLSRDECLTATKGDRWPYENGKTCPLARVVDDLALGSTRQVEIAHEHVSRIEPARIVAVVGPPRVFPVSRAVA